MSLTTAQLEELQTIALALANTFPDNEDDRWWAAIRIFDADQGPSVVGQSAFDATLADIRATQQSIQSYQGKLGSQSSAFRSATLQVVGGGITYSTSESPTGDTWIDGKPIFRRVFQLIPGTNSSILDLTGDIPNWEKWTNAYWTGREALQFIAGFENAGGVNGIRFNLINSVLAVFHQGITPTEITAVVEYTKV